MNGTVIDTLRYADRLKAAGVEPGQAEAMSRALNAELTEGLVTKRDLDAATAALRADLGTAIRELEHKVDAGFAAVDGKFATVDAQFEAMDAKFDAKFEAMDAKFEGLSSQFTSQGRYVFLALALIASLGLYNAIAPLVVGKASQQSGPSQPVPATVERSAAPPNP